MRISEVREQLDAVRSRVGDVEVAVETYHSGGSVVDVYAWDTDAEGTVAVLTTVACSDALERID